MKSRFQKSGNTLVHKGIHPVTGESFERTYWIPAKGGYVYLDTTGTRPGTLGSQPVYSTGSTWYAPTIEQLADIVRSEWQIEKSFVRNAPVGDTLSDEPKKASGRIQTCLNFFPQDP